MTAPDDPGIFRDGDRNMGRQRPAILDEKCAGALTADSRAVHGIDCPAGAVAGDDDRSGGSRAVTDRRAGGCDHGTAILDAQRAGGAGIATTRSPVVQGDG